jgi:hypothetical protein
VIDMRYLTTIVAMSASLIATLPALADDVPTLNVQQLCHGIATLSNDPLARGEPSVGYDRCMDAEKQDRERLKKVWSNFSAEEKRHCVAETMMGGQSSYTELITCLEMARDVKNLKTQMAPSNSKN